MVNREPERTPQTAPDLEALRKDETYRMDVLLDVLPPMYRGDELSRYTAAVEARVRAEEEHILRIAHVNTTATLEANITLRAERDAARAEVERLRWSVQFLLDEVERTTQWREAARNGGMKPATDTSAFAMVVPSGLNEIRRVLRAALSTEAAQ